MMHLFEGCGIELEYMIVDRSSLDVAPIADRVLKTGSGSSDPVNEYPRGPLGWSNELVMHVLELKNVAPTSELAALGKRLHDEVRAMNGLLARFGARLMGGGMHPWMNPARETQIWPHENAAVYAAYDAIFGCRSHGWANVQATHVNLPFATDQEFARLHAAVRVILPILPALAAASPYADGRATALLDYRMEAYRTNAEAVPAMNGALIPDPVTSRREYEQQVLDPLYRAIAPHDALNVLRHEWLNARGAIARFDRNAIEVRVLDAQECPQVDVAFAALIMDLAEVLCENERYHTAPDTQLPTRLLAEIFSACAHEADHARIRHAEYLRVFDVTRAECRADALWEEIAGSLERRNTPRAAVWRPVLEYVLTRGPLARRLLRAVGPRPSHGALHELYAALADALEAGKPFDP